MVELGVYWAKFRELSQNRLFFNYVRNEVVSIQDKVHVIGLLELQVNFDKIIELRVTLYFGFMQNTAKNIPKT